MMGIRYLNGIIEPVKWSGPRAHEHVLTGDKITIPTKLSRRERRRQARRDSGRGRRRARRVHPLWGLQCPIFKTVEWDWHHLRDARGTLLALYLPAGETLGDIHVLAVERYLDEGKPSPDQQRFDRTIRSAEGTGRELCLVCARPSVPPHRLIDGPHAAALLCPPHLEAWSSQAKLEDVMNALDQMARVVSWVEIPWAEVP